MNGKPQKASKAGVPNFLIDFGPLLVFFGVNFSYGIFPATLSLMVTMPTAMAVSWIKRKHIPPVLWVSGILVLIFGGLTLYFNDERFIKIKPTIIFSLFGLILLGGYLKGKALIKFLFEPAFPPIAEKGWMIISRNYGLLNLLLAGFNEFIWRTFSTDTWVTIKVFGFTALTFLFFLSQIPVIKKYGNRKLQD